MFRNDDFTDGLICNSRAHNLVKGGQSCSVWVSVERSSRNDKDEREWFGNNLKWGT